MTTITQYDRRALRGWDAEIGYKVIDRKSVGLVVAAGYYSAFGDDGDASGLKLRAQLGLGQNFYLGAEWRQNGDLTNQEWRFDAGAQFALGRYNSDVNTRSAYALPRETGPAAAPQADVAYAPVTYGGKEALQVNPTFSGKSGKAPMAIQPPPAPPPPAMLSNPSLFAPIRRTPWPLTSLRGTTTTSESFTSHRHSFPRLSRYPKCNCGPDLIFD